MVRRLKPTMLTTSLLQMLLMVMRLGPLRSAIDASAVLIFPAAPGCEQSTTRSCRNPLAFRQLPVPLAHDVWLIVVVTWAAAGRGAKNVTASTAATNTSETRRQFESFLVTNVSFLSWFPKTGSETDELLRAHPPNGVDAQALPRRDGAQTGYQFRRR